MKLRICDYFLTKVEHQFTIITTTIIIRGRRKPIARSGPGAANIICTINPIVTMASLEPRDNNNNHTIRTLRQGLTFIRNNITTIIINIRSSHRFVATVVVKV